MDSRQSFNLAIVNLQGGLFIQGVKSLVNQGILPILCCSLREIQYSMGQGNLQ